MLYATRCKRAGFTLIEIMIVVAIIAILAGIVVPNYIQARNESRLEACKQNVMSIVHAFEMCRARHSDGEIWKACGGSGMIVFAGEKLFPYLVENGYIAKIPACPLGKYDSYGYTYYGILISPYGSSWNWGSEIGCSAGAHPDEADGKYIEVRYMLGFGKWSNPGWIFDHEKGSGWVVYPDDW